MGHVHGRYSRPIADSPAFDLPYTRMPGVNQDTFVRANMGVQDCTSDLAATGTGVAIGTRIWLARNDIVTSVSFVSGNTAGATYTHWGHALYDPDGALLQQTADQVDAAWAANTRKTLALAAPVVIPEDEWYIVATWSAASTVQTLLGCAPVVTAAAQLFTSSKAPGFTFGSSIGATAPATTGTQTGVAKMPYCAVS